MTYVLLLAIVAFGVPLALSLSARVNAEVRTQAQAQADLVAATAGDLLAPASRPELDSARAHRSLVAPWPSPDRERGRPRAG